MQIQDGRTKNCEISKSSKIKKIVGQYSTGRIIQSTKEVLKWKVQGINSGLTEDKLESACNAVI